MRITNFASSDAHPEQFYRTSSISLEPSSAFAPRLGRSGFTDFPQFDSVARLVLL